HRPPGHELLDSRTDSLQRVERALTVHVHGGKVPEIREDLDQPLSVLVRTGARRVGRFKLSIVRVYGGERGLVARRAKPEMNHMRAEPGVADERRMQLKR